jgi:transmembrane sensor
VPGEGELGATEAREFEAWLQADPRHGATLRRMQGVISQMHALRQQRGPVGAGLRAGMQPSAPRSVARRTLLGLVLAGSLLGTLPLAGVSPRDWLADLHTAPAEWHSQTLSDGSQLTLAGNSAVDVEFSAGERRIRLLHGQVLVDVSHDPARPFVVQTDEGSFKALGTRFVVGQGRERSELTMLESVSRRAVPCPAINWSRGAVRRAWWHATGLARCRLSIRHVWTKPGSVTNWPKACRSIRCWTRCRSKGAACCASTARQCRPSRCRRYCRWMTNAP